MRKVYIGAAIWGALLVAVVPDAPKEVQAADDGPQGLSGPVEQVAAVEASELPLLASTTAPTDSGAGDVTPPTSSAPPVGTEPTVAAYTAPPGVSERQMRVLRLCESTDNYAAVSPQGWYRGAYQFDQRTWDDVASRHAPHLVGRDPVTVSPHEQDGMMLALHSERGWQPWPTCGPKARAA